MLPVEFRAAVIGEVYGHESRECDTPCEMHSLTVRLDGTVVRYHVSWTVYVSPGCISLREADNGSS